MLKRSARTSAEDIRQQLAARIISGALEPGMPLDESELAREFEVSRTPIREALRLLGASGLVDQRPHAKAIVAKPDEQTLTGMFEVMGYLEGLCSGLSAVSMTSSERQSLDNLHTRMAAIVRSGDLKAYTLANEEFHNVIYDGSHNPYLAEITYSTRQRVQPFRRAQFAHPGRLARSHAEHGLIVDAILQGKREDAEAHMRSHISIVEGAYQRLTQRISP